jgi:hypothetical protein
MYGKRGTLDVAPGLYCFYTVFIMTAIEALATAHAMRARAAEMRADSAKMLKEADGIGRVRTFQRKTTKRAHEKYPILIHQQEHG